MIITFSPINYTHELTISVNGDTIHINGEEYDFTALPEGAELPRWAVDCDLICSPIVRQGGEIYLTVLLPYTGNPPKSVTFPSPIHVTKDGPVELPK